MDITSSPSIEDRRWYFLFTSDTAKESQTPSGGYSVKFPENSMNTTHISSGGKIYIRPIVIDLAWDCLVEKPLGNTGSGRWSGICLEMDAGNMHPPSRILRTLENLSGVHGALVLFHYDGYGPRTLVRGKEGWWDGHWEFTGLEAKTLNFLDLHGNKLHPKQFSVVLELSNVPFKD